MQLVIYIFFYCAVIFKLYTWINFTFYGKTLLKLFTFTLALLLDSLIIC